MCPLNGTLYGMRVRFCYTAYVAYWHLADNPTVPEFVGYRTVVSTGRRNTYLEQKR